jgi:hypothetical protein
MAITEYVIRDDDRYTVVVGWQDELETFFARVFSRYSPNAQPLHELGTRPGEIPAVSILVEAVQGFATLDPRTVNELRLDAGRVQVAH